MVSNGFDGDGPGESLLEVIDLNSFYGDSQALFDVSIDVNRTEIIGIFGLNGMGKTTLLRSIVNQLVRTEGSIYFDGEDISGKPTFEIVNRGIAFVPEDRAIYSELSVTQNLDLAVPSTVSADERAERRQQVFELFPRIRERLTQPAGTLSGGEQQMMAIARGLLSDPKLLMLDEPTEGLAPVIIDDVLDAISELADRDRTILIVEQNINRFLPIIDRGYVLQNGRIEFDGLAAELEDEERQEEYLGLA